jgi:type IV pilus assembly protein PilM
MMPAHSSSVWAIEIGNDSLKALRLGGVGGVQVLGFANVSYGKILAGGGVNPTERDELIALGLRKFLRENNIARDPVIVSVPSQTSFARFVNLPPVEEKKIPQVVRLEAGMQIPFDMSEVQWDWQLMSQAGSGQARVGIFAIKNEVVTKELEYFGNEDVPVSAVQMVPMALYNYVVYDRPELVKSDKQAVAVVNIGTETTDLVVCSKTTIWQRCIPMGGNSFTRAIAETFKLNFDKAEKLKRTAAMSKYARQVFQAMRPVFTDFVSEIQRSLGFFSSSAPDCKVTHVIAMGGGTKLRGLLKYLGQTLQIPIEKPDAFKRLTVGQGVSAAQFGQSVGEFAVVYGLGLQGLGLAEVESNLLPRAIASSMALASKAKYFTLAAAALLLVVLLGIGRTVFDRAKYNAQKTVRQTIASRIRDADDAKRKLQAEEGREADSKQKIEAAYQQLQYRDAVPKVIETVLSCLPNKRNNPAQADLYDAFARGDVREVMQTPRADRKQMFVTSMTVQYADDISAEAFSQGRVSVSQWNPEVEADVARPALAVPGRSSRAASGQDGGFIVTVAGYSPYANIGDLLDPVAVQDDPNKWGVVTRLMNLDALSDANSPFELYKKTEIAHFSLQTGPVSTDEPMPAGVGERSIATGGSGHSSGPVLLDPMTKEVISTVPMTDEMGRNRLDNKGKIIYQVNDHWFVLKFKLLWKKQLSDSQGGV